MSDPTQDERTRNPGDHFDTPQQILQARDLSRTDKIAALVNWASEIRQLQVAEEENMRGAPGLAERLQAVERALLSLGVADVSHDAKS